MQNSNLTNKLPSSFYKQNALIVAEQLLGMFLCRKIKGKVYKYKITQTEAYLGKEDSASHAYKKKTNRNKTMFKQGGVVYVYLCYGLHYLLNVVTGNKNKAEGVMIRAIENHVGPGKVTRTLGIDKSFDGVSLIKSNKFWIESSKEPVSFTTAKRVGIDYAKPEDINKPWRFILD